jgi:hypothetical protein
MTDYKSKFEAETAAHLTRRGVKFVYEAEEVKFTQERTYKPDFKIGSIFVETKGYFRAADRGKHLLIKQQNPEVDIRFVFMNPRICLSKASKTTYAQWAERHGFLWAAREVPDEWIEEAKAQAEEEKKPTRKRTKDT